MTWVPLHQHSQYSILDALGSVGQIAEKAASLEMPAVALTDNGALYGGVDFFKACKKKGIKPIIGFEAYLAPDSRHEKKRMPGRPNYTSLVLLAKNEEGYRNLCRLSSKASLEGFYYYPRVDKELLQLHREGIICLVGGTSSHLGHIATNGTVEELRQEMIWYRELFGADFYLELQRHEMSEEALQADGFYQEMWLVQKYQGYFERQQKVNQLFVELGRELSIPYLATNDSHYLEREDWTSHEILLNVQSGEPCEIWEKDATGQPQFRIPNPKRKTYPSHEYYFKTPQQMAEIFADLPEALSTTLEVAEKCQMELDFDTKHYPVYEPPALVGRTYDAEEQKQKVDEFLMQLCEEGIPKRYTPERLEKVKEIHPDRDPLEVVRERLEYEMGVIAPKGLCDYLLIVWDFIHWAKTSGIPVGPGRGSGAGSIILYLIGITDIEPLRFSLFFERFINPERVSYPDIDVDICMQGRDRVIEYTVDKYGASNVAQIITFGTIKAKSALKDVGRVLSVPLSKVNAVAKLVPEDPNMTLEKALEIDADLLRTYQEDEEIKRIIDIGRRLEGAVRSTGIHAAGVIVAGSPLTDNIPICRAKDSDLSATQYSMKPVESVGMLKIDFLGLKTLTSIQICVDAIKKNNGVEIDCVNLPLDDIPTFELLNQGKTLGIFQMESGGMQDLARQLHLDKFEEIIAVLSLYRPGPMDMIPSFIARKHGREPIEYDHPWMEEILSETYGIMVYQEQVMMIAQKLANYSLGEGDVLRRAMGKKDAEQMAQERQKFTTGAVDNGIDADTASAIFDKMEKFAAYGFNKSHAAAYGFITYITAYLKANYPKEWMAALMTCDRDDTTKIAKFIGEAQSMGIDILPPDINEAGSIFTASPRGIRFAMSGIKGVGQGIVEAILEEREKNGPFESLYSLFKRTDPRKVGKKAVEMMCEAGCFDFTGWGRDAMRESVEAMHAAAVKEGKDEAAGMMSLFSLLPEEDTQRFVKPPKVIAPRNERDTLLKEKELLGFFLTGHPMKEFQPYLKRLSCASLKTISEMTQDTIIRAAFLVEEVATRIAQKSQKKFAILKISDGLERYELPIWPDVYEQSSELLGENRLLYAVLSVEMRDGAQRLSCRWLQDLTRVSDAMVAACDQAFDKEKLRMEKMSFIKKMGPKKVEEKPKLAKKPANAQMTIALDLEKTRLSHVVKLRDLLATEAGPTSVEVIFQSPRGEVATLFSAKKIKTEKTLLASLNALPNVAKVEVS